MKMPYLLLTVHERGQGGCTGNEGGSPERRQQKQLDSVRLLEFHISANSH